MRNMRPTAMNNGVVNAIPISIDISSTVVWMRMYYDILDMDAGMFICTYDCRPGVALAKYSCEYPVASLYMSVARLSGFIGLRDWVFCREIGKKWVFSLKNWLPLSCVRFSGFNAQLSAFVVIWRNVDQAVECVKCLCFERLCRLIKIFSGLLDVDIDCLCCIRSGRIEFSIIVSKYNQARMERSRTSIKSCWQAHHMKLHRMTLQCKFQHKCYAWKLNMKSCLEHTPLSYPSSKVWCKIDSHTFWDSTFRPDLSQTDWLLWAVHELYM